MGNSSLLTGDDEDDDFRARNLNATLPRTAYQAPARCAALVATTGHFLMLPDHRAPSDYTTCGHCAQADLLSPCWSLPPPPRRGPTPLTTTRQVREIPLRPHPRAEEPQGKREGIHTELSERMPDRGSQPGHGLVQTRGPGRRWLRILMRMDYRSQGHGLAETDIPRDGWA